MSHTTMRPALMMLIGKYRERQKELYCVFVCLVKENDRMSKEEMILHGGISYMGESGEGHV